MDAATECEHSILRFDEVTNIRDRNQGPIPTLKRLRGGLRWSRFVGQSEGENKVYSDCVDALDEGTLPAQADDVNGIVEAPAVVV